MSDARTATRPAFTIAERDRVRETVLEMAHADSRVVAAASIGSLATGGGDRWSDLDLGFGLADGVRTADVLADWTQRLERDLDAVHLFDLPYQSSIYRVFLFPGSLQVDLSFTPRSHFGALGPGFTLLFGSAVERPPLPAPSGRYQLGLAVHHAVRARICIERGRWWQAEYWISGVRNQALALACLGRGLEPGYGRGYDDLPPETKTHAATAIVRSIDRDELLRALGCAIDALLRESQPARDLALAVESQLRALTSTGWSES